MASYNKRLAEQSRGCGMIDFSKRQQWIDITRGLSIVFVIMYHLHGGTEYLNLIETVPGYHYFSSVVDFLNKTLSPIRMELLMLLSGMLVSKGMEKGLDRYYTGKVKSILYPYLIWSLVMLVLMSARGLVSGEKGAHDVIVYFFKIIIGVPSVTWFLYWVFVFFMIQPRLRNLSPMVVLPAVLLLSFVVSKVEYVTDDLVRGVAFSAVIYCYAFFWLGDYIIRNGIDLGQLVKNRMVVVLSAISVAALSFLMNTTELSNTSVVLFPMALLSFAMVALLAQQLEKVKVGQLFAFIGMNSIFFYLMHVPLLMIVKRAVPVLNFSDVATAIAIWVVAITVPFITVKLRKLKLVRLLFEFRWA